ncbi:hypothetical protein K9B35_18980 [Sphingomonas sp. R647]|uniref:hypothetical protein n=1 Tax=Sphingomonas sp. R647 TaxID=2875233 RepID=UPI001CD4222D|nr:hypothetical protein [Sphingomonas sp. R647]MCA1200055.1 hypothetical protein [Sphingomonas sp. R647]
MTKRTLNSDQLGKKGESRFPDLCIDAGLVPNASTYDRRGWDFIVDWHHPYGSSALDARPAPLSCLVQLKTIWTSSKTIKLRLSSIEYLAKDSRPTFIYVLRANDDLTFVDARIIHINGDFLALILAELRKARLSDSAPNSVTIRVRLDPWFETLPATGEALRAAMEGAVGPSLYEYNLKKQRELREVGYENGGGHFITTTFTGTIDHIVEAFFGMQPLDNIRTTAYERRFGMDVPIPSLSEEWSSVKFEPIPTDTATIIVYDEPSRPPFKFHANVIRLPSNLLPCDQMRLLLRTPLLDFLLSAEFSNEARASLSLNLRTNSARLETATATAEKWSALYGFLAAFRERPLTFEINFNKIAQPIVGTMTSDKADANTKWSRPAQLCAIANHALKLIGREDTELSIADIGAVDQDLAVLDAVINDPSTLSRLSTTTVRMPGPVEGDTIQAIYFKRFPLGLVNIAYATELTLAAKIEGEMIVWTGSVPALIDIAYVGGTDADYDRYIERIKSKTGVMSYFAASTPHYQDQLEEFAGDACA